MNQSQREELKQKLINFFISCCIQNAIPINIVSEKIENLNFNFNNRIPNNLVECQDLFIAELPKSVFDMYQQNAMLTGKDIETVIFTDF